MRDTGKNLSLTFKMLAGLWVGTIATIKIISGTLEISEAKAILIIGVCIAAIPLPIDISKIINNFFNKDKKDE